MTLKIDFALMQIAIGFMSFNFNLIDLSSDWVILNTISLSIFGLSIETDYNRRPALLGRSGGTKSSLWVVSTDPKSVWLMIILGTYLYFFLYLGNWSERNLYGSTVAHQGLLHQKSFYTLQKVSFSVMAIFGSRSANCPCSSLDMSQKERKKENEYTSMDNWTLDMGS